MEDTTQNEQAIRKGRAEIIVLFSTALTISLGIIVIYNVWEGQDNLFAQIVRTMATILAMYFTYQGSKAAKWILTALYVFGAVSIVHSNSASVFSYDNFLAYLFAFYVFFACCLRFSNNISLFLKAQGSNLKQGGTV